MLRLVLLLVLCFHPAPALVPGGCRGSPPRTTDLPCRRATSVLQPLWRIVEVEKRLLLRLSSNCVRLPEEVDPLDHLSSSTRALSDWGASRRLLMQWSLPQILAAYLQPVVIAHPGLTYPGHYPPKLRKEVLRMHTARASEELYTAMAPLRQLLVCSLLASPLHLLRLVYYSLLSWVLSTRVGSLVGSLVGRRVGSLVGRRVGSLVARGPESSLIRPHLRRALVPSILEQVAGALERQALEYGALAQPTPPPALEWRACVARSVPRLVRESALAASERTRVEALSPGSAPSETLRAAVRAAALSLHLSALKAQRLLKARAKWSTMSRKWSRLSRKGPRALVRPRSQDALERQVVESGGEHIA